MRFSKSAGKENMEIRYLKLFRHLAGTLHFARTAQACYITPSALTRVIQRLEAELGETLFFRDNRSVELTPAGMSFKKYADDVLARWENLHDELSAEATLHGELSLYCSVTAAYDILPGLMARYRKAHPNVGIHLETGDPGKAILKLSNQDADMVITAKPDHLPKEMVFQPIQTTPLVFIAPEEFPDVVIRTKQGVEWNKSPLIIPDRGLSRERIDQWFAAENFIPNIYSQVAGNEAIIVMVSLGFGIGLVPRLVLENSPFISRVRILSDAPELPPYIIGLSTRKKSLLNPRIKALWQIAQTQ